MISSQPAIGKLIKNLLDERSWSMGDLSSVTGIDKASISRIASGKRKPTLDHLQQFSTTFGVPLALFLEAAGYPPNTANEKADFCEDLGTAAPSPEAVKQELRRFEAQAQTEQGHQQIEALFEAKVKKLESSGPYIDQLYYFYHRFRTRSGTSQELALIGAALLYFIAPIDVIPDYIFPLGYVDDAMAVQFVRSFLQAK